MNTAKPSNEETIVPISFYPFSFFDENNQLLPDFVAYEETPEKLGFTAREFALKALLDIEYAGKENSKSSKRHNISVSCAEGRFPEKELQDCQPIYAGPSAQPAALPLALNEAQAHSHVIGSAFTSPSTELSVLTPQMDKSSKNSRDYRNQEMSPYAVAQILISKIRLLIVGNLIYLFDGKIYRLLTEIELKRQLMNFCRSYVENAGHAGVIKQIYECLYMEPKLAYKTLELPSSLMAFQDYVVNPQTMEYRPHSPEYFLTSIINANYAPNEGTACPTFDQFLADISCGDMSLVQRIWEFVGYCLVPDMAGKYFFLLQGVPDSGKSVLGDFLAHCFDEEAVTSLDLSAFGERFSLYELIGKRLDLALDMPACSLDSHAVSNLKMLTGGDIISTDVKYQARAKFYSICKMIFATNHAFVTRTPDPALLKRLVVIPFRNSIARSRQDVHLRAKLNAERGAIIKKALVAYRYLVSNNYCFSGNFEVNTVIAPQGECSAANMDQAIADFIFSRCRVEPEAVTFLDDIFASFMQAVGGLNMTLAQFSARVEAILRNHFDEDITRSRKRKPGAQNPTSCLIGIRFTVQ